MDILLIGGPMHKREIATNEFVVEHCVYVEDNGRSPKGTDSFRFKKCCYAATNIMRNGMSVFRFCHGYYDPSYLTNNSRPYLVNK